MRHVEWYFYSKNCLIFERFNIVYTVMVNYSNSLSDTYCNDVTWAPRRLISVTLRLFVQQRKYLILPVAGPFWAECFGDWCINLDNPHKRDIRSSRFFNKSFWNIDYDWVCFHDCFVAIQIEPINVNMITISDLIFRNSPHENTHFNIHSFTVNVAMLCGMNLSETESETMTHNLEAQGRTISIFSHTPLALLLKMILRTRHQRYDMSSGDQATLNRLY